MPFYRIDDMLVHLKLARRAAVPACCAPHVWPDGVRRHCRAMSTRLCDADLGHGLTCDMPLCEEHAVSVGENVDRCPRHAPTGLLPAASK